MSDPERQDTVLISLGGSILAPETIGPQFVAGIAALIGELARDRRLIIVTGGGRTARNYIGAGRELGASEFFLDEMGIAASRLNARLLMCALGGLAPPTVPDTMPDTLVMSAAYPVVVCGGSHPGHTTDAVAALLAEASGASLLVNATSVDGVYDKDPATHDDARHIPELTADELVDLCIRSAASAGPNVVMDPLAARVIARSSVTCAVVDGRDADSLRAAVLGGDFKGTRVIPSPRGR